jgi:delta-1-pyrroline-5-carboxylate synthetase
MRGDHIGTLFHKDSYLWVDVKETGARDMAVSARDASRQLQSLSSEERKKILLTVSDALVANEARIKIENDADVEAAQLSGIAKSLIGRLTIKPGKIASLAKSLRVLADMKDPIGAVSKRTEVCL